MSDTSECSLSHQRVWCTVENGVSQLAGQLFSILCDIGSELGESKGARDPPGTAAPGLFWRCLIWERASQEGPRILSHAKQLRDLKTSTEHWATPIQASGFFSDRRMETRSSRTREVDSLFFVAKQKSFPAFTFSKPQFPCWSAPSCLTGESQCMPPTFSGRLRVQQPHVYIVLWSLQGEIWISLPNFKPFWTCSISDKSYLW